MVMDELKNTQERGDFTIEDAKPEDIEKIRTIARDAWLEIYPNETYGITREDIEAIGWFDPMGLKRRRKEIRENRDTIRVWVVKDDKDNVVGFCKVSKDGHKTDTEEQREIDAMYVVKELQGKGLGKKLMQKAMEWLGTDGNIRLEVVSYNNNAINFYKGFGFQETALPVSDKRTQLPSKKQIPRIVMIKPKAEEKQVLP
jgi:GNAT superfamily N-acetyltransferase